MLMPAAEGSSRLAVSLRGVTRVFGLVPGVVRVDLTVEPGEVVLIRGPNGSGKTTLLRIIATALSPTAGSGSVLGFDLVRQRQDVRRYVGLLGHRTRLYEDLTAAENLRFGCALHGADPKGVPAVLDRVGLAAVGVDRVRGFSQGMRQRLALARLLLREPSIMLLDEPWAGLDEQAKQLVDDVIGEAAREGRTVLLASHDVTRLDVPAKNVRMAGGRLYRQTAPAQPRGANA